MRTVLLAELRELLRGGPFAAWWADLGEASLALARAAERRRDLLAQAEHMELRSEAAQRAALDAFSDGGEAEDRQARLRAEAQDLENRALALVGLFEEQRFRTSNVWYRLGGLERTLEEATSPEARQPLERQLPVLQEEYAQADGRRSRLWAEVEETWARSFERSLLGHEHGERARRIRREAERLFREAEERRQRARQLKAEADLAGREEAAAALRRAALLERATGEFGCVHGDRFLYWGRRGEKRSAFVVPLADEPNGEGSPLTALEVYLAGPVRGVAALEPARDEPAAVEEGPRPAQDDQPGRRPQGR